MIYNAAAMVALYLHRRAKARSRLLNKSKLLLLIKLRQTLSNRKRRQVSSSLIAPIFSP
jgi:hypothetical protein